MKRAFYKGRFIFMPLACATFLSLISYAVMLLWNWLIPGIFGYSIITFWQAMGLFILSKLLFGFGRGGGRCGPFGGGGAPWMKRKMEEKLRNMTPEERERFKQKMQERCGNHPFAQKWKNWTEEAKTPEH
ncbi:hypothetical protein [Mucilaginibacter auburnensis]|uniref:Uncharacterized protein n=1 Tax=Mucilaginibacter auburnensis TaxID=1457233 RepID=A0A2H9VTK2_9SPHI|nr:hypothetical protein [Mucilaginibacter auburnensis]PJJ84141.1 hypothetical protein CLV57_1145 [Mucilaginibacter auburnensis]